jgi:hypothetical protein
VELLTAKGPTNDGFHGWHVDIIRQYSKLGAPYGAYPGTPCVCARPQLMDTSVATPCAAHDEVVLPLSDASKTGARCQQQAGCSRCVSTRRSMPRRPRNVE